MFLRYIGLTLYQVSLLQDSSTQQVVILAIAGGTEVFVVQPFGDTQFMVV